MILRETSEARRRVCECKAESEEHCQGEMVAQGTLYRTEECETMSNPANVIQKRARRHALPPWSSMQAAPPDHNGIDVFTPQHPGSTTVGLEPHPEDTLPLNRGPVDPASGSSGHRLPHKPYGWPPVQRDLPRCGEALRGSGGTNIVGIWGVRNPYLFGAGMSTASTHSPKSPSS